jgi:NTP pyrophosphatase (non-canonical NTP hydrolase)
VYGITQDDAWFMLKLQEEVGELTQAFLMRSGQARTKDRTPEELDANFADELADVLCMTLVMARHHGVDIEAAVERKWLAWKR